VRLRAERLGALQGVGVLAETELDVVCATIEQHRDDFGVAGHHLQAQRADLPAARFPGLYDAGGQGEPSVGRVQVSQQTVQLTGHDQPGR
jgi:hypothetical protein